MNASAVSKRKAPPPKTKHVKNSLWMLAIPLYACTLVLVVLPLFYVLGVSFLKNDGMLGAEGPVTLENYAMLPDPTYLRTFLDSLVLAFATTAITIAAGYPFGYLMAKLPPKKGGLVLMAVMIPFWTNALVRIYGWKIFLRADGVVNTVLQGLGVIDEPLKLLYTYGAVLVGMVYSLLPFMILPVYNSVQKMDWSLVEAARDLGASRARAFLTVTLPRTLPGLLSGVVLVFVPSIGLFFLSDILGGAKIMLVGNLIRNEMLNARDLPFAAALAVVMMVMTMLILLLYRKVTHAQELEGLA